MSSLAKEFKTDTALILVDVQNDFCPGGSLAIPSGDEVVWPLNHEVTGARNNGWMIIAGRDWHPEVSKHFKDFGGVWPIHCVQNTEGARFHPDLDTEGAIIISKGMDPDNVDSYSEFLGITEDGKTLEQLLRESGVTRVLVGGLATDFCVKATAIDAANLGFETYILRHASRPVFPGEAGELAAIKEMYDAGVVGLFNMDSSQLEGSNL